MSLVVIFDDGHTDGIRGVHGGVVLAVPAMGGCAPTAGKGPAPSASATLLDTFLDTTHERFFLIISTELKAVKRLIRVVHGPKCKESFSIDYRERRTHERGVCIPTQDTSRMGTARVKQDEEADTKIIARE